MKRQRNVLIGDISKFLILAVIFLCSIRILAAAMVPFTDTTEARYAEIARKMVETQDWITPYFDYGIPFWGKPPLHTWMAAIGFKIWGTSELAGRIFFASVSLFLILILFDFVRKEVNRHIALWTIFILCSSGLFFGSIAFVSTDIPLTFGCVMIMLAFWRYHECTAPNYRAILGFAFGLTIGFLAKGPIVILIVGVAVLAWTSFIGRWSVLFNTNWIIGICLFLIMSLPWFVIAELRTPGFAYYFFVEEHFYRFLISGWEGDRYGNGHAFHKGKIWLDWGIAFAPWSILLIGGYIYRVIQKEVCRPTAWLRSKTPSLESYLLCWIISPLIIFTMSANILTAYVLPAIPATAILTALVVRDLGLSKYIQLTGIQIVTIFYCLMIAVLLLNTDNRLLKSERATAEWVYGNFDDVDITYLGKRSFSLEFYSAGQVERIDHIQDVEMLLENDQQDALVLLQSDLSLLSDEYQERFYAPYMTNRRAILIEKWEQ